jgi:purine-cytosine permease-like protein
MNGIKKIGYFLLIITTMFAMWLVISFVDIATKNHISDKNYKQYSDWNMIIILTDYASEVNG